MSKKSLDCDRPESRSNAERYRLKYNRKRRNQTRVNLPTLWSDINDEVIGFDARLQCVCLTPEMIGWLFDHGITKCELRHTRYSIPNYGPAGFVLDFDDSTQAVFFTLWAAGQ